MQETWLKVSPMAVTDVPIKVARSREARIHAMLLS
jgi:hypothetical protein